MINLFSSIKINPIQISNFDHYLHGLVVTQYEEEFADYVGAKYAIAANSETSLLFILFNNLQCNIETPSIYPPVVANAIINGDNSVSFNDNVEWVGKSYSIKEGFLLDSAQEVYQNQYKIANHEVILYSNYPTKPVAGIDGGVLVCNDKSLIDDVRTLLYNGMDISNNSWDRKQTAIGWKMYMSSIQAATALHSLRQIGIKKEKLGKIRKKYNRAFSLDNISDHLYRVSVEDNQKAIVELKNKGIICGIHYKPLHELSVFNPYRSDIGKDYPLSSEVGKTTLSIPFHEDLTDGEIDQVINEVSPYV